MKRIAQFFKVSRDNFMQAVKEDFPQYSETEIQEMYESLKLPGLYPRSGLGFKYRLQMNNTVGIIDSDYYNSDNEGHIFIKMTNDTNEGKKVEVAQGTGFAQGIFIEYGITVDDEAAGIRNGGLGSTTGD